MASKVLCTSLAQNRTAYRKPHLVTCIRARNGALERHFRGWGEDVRTVEAVIKDDPECLAMFREAMAKQGERNDLDNNVIHVDTPQGNSRAYSIDRVKRECDPEVVAKVMSGEMSPNAALVRMLCESRSTPFQCCRCWSGSAAQSRTSSHLSRWRAASAIAAGQPAA